MAKIPITSKGKKWELLNSWWILTAIAFCGFIGFFYIGVTAKQKKWKISGAVYFVIWFVLFCLIQGSDLTLALFLISWVVSIMHSFRVRKEYLIRREYIIKNKLHEKKKNAKLVKIQQEIRKEYEGDTISAEQLRESVEKCVELPKTQSEVSSALDLLNRSEENMTDTVVAESANMEDGKVDINNCSVQELASLPGVSVVIAKKAEMYRREHRGFSSVDEFFSVIALKPHFVEQIQDLIICQKMVGDSKELENVGLNDEESTSKEKKGRVLDF